MSKRFRTQPSPEVSQELRDAFSKDTPPGECEHEWEMLWHMMEGYPEPSIDGYICQKCNETRTVADFWSNLPPHHENTRTVIFARQKIRYKRSEDSEWSPPFAVTVREAWGTCLHAESQYEFFHHPDYIIEPPPTPDSSHVPNP